MDKKDKDALLQSLQDLSMSEEKEGIIVDYSAYIETLKNIINNDPSAFCEICAELPMMPPDIIEFILEEKPDELKSLLMMAIIKNVDNYVEYANAAHRTFSLMTMEDIFSIKTKREELLKAFAENGFWIDPNLQVTESKKRKALRDLVDNTTMQEILRAYLNGPNKMELHWKLQLFILCMPDARDLIAKYMAKGHRLHPTSRCIAAARGFI